MEQADYETSPRYSPMRPADVIHSPSIPRMNVMRAVDMMERSPSIPRPRMVRLSAPHPSCRVSPGAEEWMREREMMANSVQNAYKPIPK